MLRSRRTDQRALARIKKVESAAVTSGWYFASCVAAEKHVNCQHFRCSSASLCTASRGLTSRVVNNISHVENIIDLLKSFSTIPQVTRRVKQIFGGEMGLERAVLPWNSGRTGGSTNNTTRYLEHISIDIHERLKAI